MLEDSIRRLLNEKLSDALEARGITEVGAHVPVSGGIANAGMSGPLISPWWSAGLHRTLVKKQQKAKVTLKRLMSRTKGLSKQYNAKKKAGAPSNVVKRELLMTANSAVVAAKEVDAPTITKAEVIDSMQPAVGKAAKQIAKGIRAETRKATGKGMFREGGPSADAFFQHPELDWDFQSLGIGPQMIDEECCPDWFPTHPSQDWNFDYVAQRYSPANRGSIL